MIKKKLKILVVSGWYPGRLEPFNGDFVRDQVAMLRSEGFAIDLVYADLNIAYFYNNQYSKRYKIAIDAKGNKDFIMSGPFWPKNMSWGLNRWVKAYSLWIRHYISICGKPDIIHAHTYLGAMVAQKIKDDHKIPFVMTEHYTGWMDGSIKRSHNEKGIVALQSAKKVTAVSQALADQLMTEISKDVMVLNNFIDTSVFKSSEFKLDERAKNQPFRLVTIGDLIPRKRVDHVIRLVARLNDSSQKNMTPDKVNLDIIGSGSSDTILKELVSRLGLEGQVSFLGQLSKKQIVLRLQQCHLLVHTSKLETFGLVTSEALCCGVPVVSYNNQGIREISNLSGLFITQSPTIESLQRQVTQLIQGYNNLDRIAISRDAQKRLGVKSIVEKTTQIYQSLLV